LFTNRDPYPYIANIEPEVGVVQEAGYKPEVSSLHKLHSARHYSGAVNKLRWSTTIRWENEWTGRK
jgi:hypothetical protein